MQCAINFEIKQNMHVCMDFKTWWKSNKETEVNQICLNPCSGYNFSLEQLETYRTWWRVYVCVYNLLMNGNESIFQQPLSKLASPMHMQCPAVHVVLEKQFLISVHGLWLKGKDRYMYLDKCDYGYDYLCWISSLFQGKYAKFVGIYMYWNTF